MRLRSTILRRRLVGAMGGALALIACASARQARAERPGSELGMSVATGPAMPLGAAAERWAASISEADAGFVVKLRPGAVVASRDPAREFLALKEGAADLAVGSAMQWAMQVPALAIFSLPWIAPQDGDLVALAADGPLREALSSRMTAAGVVLVDVAPLGYLEIATLSRAIRAPEDVKGLRLRAAPSPLLHDLLLALGALPLAMSFREAQSAFANGALDGQVGSPSAFAASSAGASRHGHLTDWGAVGDAMLFAVRKPVWDGWTQAQRDRVRASARAAIAAADPLARDAAAVAELARRGVSVVRITPAGHVAFRGAVAAVEARWSVAIGADVVTLAEQALAIRRGASAGR